MRINRFLAAAGLGSRRACEDLVRSGRVLINNAVVTDLATKVEPTDIVRVGRKVVRPQPHVYILLNKPVGYVCSRRPQGESPTIYSIIPHEYHALKPVGRLDRNSSGLILLTNDGDFAFKMTHPKFSKTKVYHVRIDHDLQPLHQQMISDFGVDLEDGRSQLTLARLSDDRRDQWEVTMSEGRNRQIRRTFAALGYTVKELHRVQFGNYVIGDMKPGELVPVDIR